MITYPILIKMLTEADLPGPAERDLWWAERGVDHGAIEQFGLEDAADTIVTTVPQLLASTYGEPVELEGLGEGIMFPASDLPALIAAVAAMHTETGFMLGWLAYERHAKGPIEL